MPYRKFILPEECGTVLTRVSDEATMEWWLHWYRTGGQGTRARPPDVDTETIRMWVGPTSDEEWEIWQKWKEDKDDTAMRAHYGGLHGWPLSTFTVTTLERTIKILLVEDTDADPPLLKIRFKGENEVTSEIFAEGDQEFGPDDMDEANDLFQKSLFSLNKIHELFGEDPTWMITLPSEFEAMEQEIDRAKEDFDAISDNGPLPVARYPSNAINEVPA